MSLLVQPLPNRQVHSLFSREKAVNDLHLDQERLAKRQQTYLASFNTLQKIPSCLAIVIGVPAQQIKVPLEQRQLWLRIGLYRPGVGHTLLYSDDSRYTLTEIREHLLRFCNEQRLPSWGRQNLFLEFVLPLTLLYELRDEWKPHSWLYQTSDPFADDSELPIGVDFPSVVRSLERLKMSNRKLWQDKWNTLAGWLANTDSMAQPRMVNPRPGHSFFVAPDAWGSDDTIIAMVLDTPLTTEDAEVTLKTMLRSGLPVGLWLNQSKNEAYPIDMQAFFTPEALRNLPHRIRDQRKHMWHVHRHVTNLVLFWDDGSHIPPDGALRDPDKEM